MKILGESNNQQQQESGGSSNKEQDSKNSSSSSSSGQGSSKENTSEENTKYEIINDSILANDNKTIEWKQIKSNIESIHATWATLTVDLHSLNVKNEDILTFSDVLDQVTINAKQKNKIATLNNLATLYAFFPNYITQISGDNEKININNTKACVLNSYALAEQDKWEEMKLQVANAINNFTNILNSVNQETQNQGSINRIYVLLNELNNSINLRDKDLYIIKYKNVMEELINLK